MPHPKLIVATAGMTNDGGGIVRSVDDLALASLSDECTNFFLSQTTYGIV